LRCDRRLWSQGGQGLPSVHSTVPEAELEVLIDYVVCNLLEFPIFETNTAYHSFHRPLLAFVRWLPLNVNQRYCGILFKVSLQGLQERFRSVRSTAGMKLGDSSRSLVEQTDSPFNVRSGCRLGSIHLGEKG
jgi:hypothetical protein